MKNKTILVLFASTLFIAACGGDSTSTIKQGQFIDSAVEGLRYVSGSQSGTTDASGRFYYEDGNTVQFYVGKIFIGEAMGDTVITPVELVEGASDTTHPTAINIARFLQTLDDDGNPENGIMNTELVISNTKKSLNFEQSFEEFSNDDTVLRTVSELTALTSSGAKNLVTANAANTHLERTISLQACTTDLCKAYRYCNWLNMEHKDDKNAFDTAIKKSNWSTLQEVCTWVW